MGLAITTYPTEAEILALLSVAEMKASLRISYSVEDDYIKACILQAYDWLAGAKGWLNTSILTTVWTLKQSSFGTKVELPKPPTVSVTSVGYLLNGSLSTLSPSAYGLKRGADGYGYLMPASGGSWPTGDTDDEAVQVVYVSGYGNGAFVKANHPALVRAMMLLAGDYFRVREDTFTDIRVVEIDRKVINNVERVAGRYRFFNDFA